MIAAVIDCLKPCGVIGVAESVVEIHETVMKICRAQPVIELSSQCVFLGGPIVSLHRRARQLPLETVAECQRSDATHWHVASASWR